MSEKWLVNAGGTSLELAFSDGGLLVGGPDGDVNVPHEAWLGIEFPNAYCAVLPLSPDASVQVGFATRDEQKAFANELKDQQIARGIIPAEARGEPTPRAKVALYTIAEIPGRRIISALGMVTSESVMSRGLFSDAGSDFKSVVGGNLVGMERAVREAVESAKTSLANSARQLGGDAVIGVSVSIAGVGDKAEAIVMAGTAVHSAPTVGPDTTSAV